MISNIFSSSVNDTLGKDVPNDLDGNNLFHVIIFLMIFVGLIIEVCIPTITVLFSLLDNVSTRINRPHLRHLLYR